MLSNQVLLSLALSIATSSASPAADPIAEALGFAKPAEASYECHSYCGNAIIEARKCSSSGSDSDYDSNCLCSSGSSFLSLVPDCLDCGWCLWDDYGSYLTSALAECSTSTQPTGTSCAASTTAAATTEAASSAAATTEAATSAAAATEAASSAAATEATTSAAATEAAATEAAAEAATTEAASSAQTTASTSSAPASASAQVQSFTGGANKLQLGASIGFAGLAALLIWVIARVLEWLAT